jgi:single-stranded-DNA-specific exonuclease
MSRGVRLAAPPRVVGQGGGHLKLRLVSDDGTQLEMIGWGMGARAAELDLTTPIDVAFRLERDEWNGEMRLQGRLADLRVCAS